MKTLLGLVIAIVLLGCALAHFGCAVAPQCKGDPLLMPCSCMNPASLDCPPVPSDATRKDGGAR